MPRDESCLLTCCIDLRGHQVKIHSGNFSGSFEKAQMGMQKCNMLERSVLSDQSTDLFDL